MNLLMRLIAFTVLIIVSHAVINTEVQRIIDISSSVTKLSIDLKISEITNEYKLAFSNYQAERLAFLSITKKGKKLNPTAPVS